MIVKRFTFLLALLAALPATTAVTLARPITFADVRALVGVGQPRISRDGNRIAFTVRRADYVKDTYRTDLVLLELPSRRSHVLVHDREVSGFDWSPDGTLLAYAALPSAPPVASESGPQLFSLRFDGGEPLQITHVAHGVQSFAWRPDGRALAYSTQDRSPLEQAFRAHQDAFDVSEDAWIAAAATLPAHLWEVPAAGGKSRRLTHGSWTVSGGFTYAADGHSIFFGRTQAGAHPNLYLARVLARVNTSNGVLRFPRTLGVAASDPIRSRDGRFLSYVSGTPAATMQNQSVIAEANGTGPRVVSNQLDRNVGAVAFLPDDALLVAANDGTRRRLYRIASNGSVSGLQLGALNVSGAPSASGNGTIAFAASSPVRPAELYVTTTRDQMPVRLTNYNARVERLELGLTRTISWPGAGGFTVDGVLTAPPAGVKHGARAPLVLYIHGGPTATSTTSFSSFVQLLAARGWYVLQPNYRGSDNLGARFARATVPRITSAPAADILAGIRLLETMHLIDPARIGISGWSEGGLMTSWLITHATWKAAVSGAAVNDWAGYAAMTDAKSFTPQFIGPSPWKTARERALYASESPLTYAANVRTPTLIMTDAGDQRVPTPLAYEFYHEIRATGTPVQFVVYPVNGHFPTDPVRAEDINRRWLGWFVRYL